MSRNRQIALSSVIVLAVTVPGYIAVNQLLWRAFGVNNPWINGFFMGAFLCLGIVVVNWIDKPRRKS